MREVVELARAAYGTGEVRYGDGDSGPHEAGWLALETAKVCTLLGVQPRWDLSEVIARTMRWYRMLQDGADAFALCNADLRAYLATEESE